MTALAMAVESFGSTKIPLTPSVICSEDSGCSFNIADSENLLILSYLPDFLNFVSLAVY
jgi:hypothetical protein